MINQNSSRFLRGFYCEVVWGRSEAITMRKRFELFSLFPIYLCFLADLYNKSTNSTVIVLTET